MPFINSISDAHYYASIGSAGATIPVRALRSGNKPLEQSEQPQELDPVSPASQPPPDHPAPLSQDKDQADKPKLPALNASNKE